jgi:hypothetical protein
MKRTVILIGLLGCISIYSAPAICETAREMADRHEKMLSTVQTQALVSAQGVVGGKALAECTAGLPTPGPTKFALIMRLDAIGKISETWLEGEAPLAKCFQTKMSSQYLFKPPFAPFYTVFELDLKTK